MATDPKTKQKRLTLVALVGAGVAIALGQAIPREESGRTVQVSVAPVDQHLILRNVSGRQYLKVYLDMVGVKTACDGITTYHGKPLDIHAHFTEDQCSSMLEEELVKHAEGVMKDTPGLAISHNPTVEHLREGPRFAAVSLAYNLGNGAYHSSTARKRFNAYDYVGGCTALTWFNKAGGKVSPGLTARRAREYRKCTKGLAA